MRRLEPPGETSERVSLPGVQMKIRGKLSSLSLLPGALLSLQCLRGLPKTSPGARHSPAIQNAIYSEAKKAVGAVGTRNPLAAPKQEYGTSHVSEVSFLVKGWEVGWEETQEGTPE